MLHLQRASAGSGKTYTLAKTFIFNLVTIDNGRGGVRLRTPAEISDGLQRILAVTFTNKATNEMKQRIVEAVAALADKPVSGKTAYLSDIIEATGAAAAEVQDACRHALSILLNRYSDFKVSTIDSFFQSVLRTFAYETDLNDSYQVELDTEYVSSSAFDALLDEVNSSRNERGKTWLRLVMGNAMKGNGKWNVFQKSTGRMSEYSTIINAIGKLESEDFKTIREELDAWWAEHPDFISTYRRIFRHYDETLRRLHKEAADAARNLWPLYERYGFNIATDARYNMYGQLCKLVKAPHTGMGRATPKWQTWEKASPLTGKVDKTASSEAREALRSACASAYEYIHRWQAAIDSPEMSLWHTYSRLLPYLCLIMEVRTKMNEWLEDTNTVQLGETNSILRRIIGDDDAPFIYERLGSRINHYLIDEFQDTSVLQWEVLRPLLHESDSRGNDNLIIGDAKQSIYRFRNAEPKLITSIVPAEFNPHHAAGMSVEENTNWRSRRNVVEFNNYFFSALCDTIPHALSDYIDFKDLYSNVVQRPHHTDTDGYVQIDFLESLMSKSSDEADENDVMPHVVPMITELLERGYRYRDIAVLVRRRSEAQAAINSITEYNNNLPDGAIPIEFISEDSMKVSSSPAVKLIVSALEAINDGRMKETGDNSDSRVSISDIKCNFNFYSMQHPELEPAERIERFLADDDTGQALDTLLHSMQTTSLPALTEAIAESFLDPGTRAPQTLFIAAFQDMVADYCERQNSDIASFLEWWRAKGRDQSISTPEDTDAVQIMTIHKSKGLEFPCVIVPNATFEITEAKGSIWKWVHPSDKYEAMAGLPPFIPVEVRTSLKDTPHADVYNVTLDMNMMDNINTAYVAFTRAERELYIFAKKPGKSLSNLSDFLAELCDPAKVSERSGEYIIKDSLMEKTETDDYIRVTVGEKAAHVDMSDKKKEDGAERFVIDDYDIHSSLRQLQYRDAEVPTLFGEDELGMEDGIDEEDSDPRSEGNILHAVMSLVETAEDLPRAILTLRMKGTLDREMAVKAEKMIGEAISAPETAGWFDGSMRVLNERDIFISRSRNRRPDRVMIDRNSGKAIVVDYKFGSSAAFPAHKKQVTGYADALLASGICTEVTPYVWYVREGSLRKV